MSRIKCGEPACHLEYGHDGVCQGAPTPLQLGLYMNDSIFEGFGSNWQWASIDYRGVARIHTFPPTFSATGRLLVPQFKSNSATCEAFDIVENLPDGWTPMYLSRRACAPSLPTDRFGVTLPAGADPVEAADVKPAQMVPPPPAPLPQIAYAMPPDRPFAEYIERYRFVGSRVTCNPPPLTTDQDVLCMVHQENRQAIARALIAEGFVAEGSWPTDAEAIASDSQVFESMRKGSMNYIITSDEDFYKRFLAATAIAKKYNIMEKAGRIELFQAVLYGNGSC